MINLLPRNRICSKFISSPVNVRLALSPPRSPPFLSNKFLLNADRRLCTPKRLSPGLYSRLPISRSGARHAKTSSYREKNFRQAPPISIPPKEWICGTYVQRGLVIPRGAVAGSLSGSLLQGGLAGASLCSALKGDCILLLILARSFLAIKRQNGLEIGRNFLKIRCANPLAIG